MKISNIKFLLIISFCILISSSSISFAQLPQPTAPIQSDVRVTAPAKQTDVRVTAPQADVRVTAPADTGIFTLKNPLKVDSIGGLIQSFIQIFTYLVIMFAVLMFIYIGFKYVYFASQGNSSEISKLHGQLMWLIAGVAIVIGARVLIQVVINTLSATGTVDPGVINSANDALQGR